MPDMSRWFLRFLPVNNTVKNQKQNQNRKYWKESSPGWYLLCNLKTFHWNTAGYMYLFFNLPHPPRPGPPSPHNLSNNRKFYLRIPDGCFKSLYNFRYVSFTLSFVGFVLVARDTLIDIWSAPLKSLKLDIPALLLMSSLLLLFVIVQKKQPDQPSDILVHVFVPQISRESFGGT